MYWPLKMQFFFLWQKTKDEMKNSKIDQLTFNFQWIQIELEAAAAPNGYKSSEKKNTDNGENPPQSLGDAASLLLSLATEWPAANQPTGLLPAYCLN